MMKKIDCILPSILFVFLLTAVLLSPKQMSKGARITH